MKAPNLAPPPTRNTAQHNASLRTTDPKSSGTRALPPEALAYLRAIRPGRATDLYQTFPEAPDAKGYAQQFQSARAGAGRPLALLNRRGHGVFVALSDFSTPRRLIENVARVCHVWLDLDGAPLPGHWPLEPHAVVESSPSRYQAVWRVKELPQDAQAHNRMLLALAELYGGDSGARGINRVLRLPGYYHLKHEPHLVRLGHASEGPSYSLGELFRVWPSLEDAAKEPPRPADRELPLENTNGYARAALRNECERVSGTVTGLNSVLTASSFSIGTLVGAGAIDETLARYALLHAAMNAAANPRRDHPFTEREALGVIARGLAAGASNPRDLEAKP